jgi:chromosome segregation ATPase
MRKKSSLYQLTLGLLMGALIMPAHPARAQWAVYDAANHKTQIQKRIEDARRHVQTFDNAVKQYTTLKGVLGKAEELVTDRLVSKKTMKEIGMTVRASLQLKEHTEGIIKTRLTMLKSIDDRLKRGIFDPEADLRDLEDYLRTSIGRSSQDSLANLERLRAMDNTLERLTTDLLKAEKALADVQDEKKTWVLKLQIATSPQAQESQSNNTDSDTGIGTIMQMINKCDMLIKDYTNKIEDLQMKIAERNKKYHALMDERIKFGEQVGAANNAWTEFSKKVEEIEKSLRYF